MCGVLTSFSLLIKFPVLSSTTFIAGVVGPWSDATGGTSIAQFPVLSGTTFTARLLGIARRTSTMAVVHMGERKLLAEAWVWNDAAEA